MKKGERSKAKIVDATAALLQRQGYHATGVNQIIRESGAPKGSLYFHFPGGKEEIARAALEAAGTSWRERLQLVVDAAPTPGDAILFACRALAAELEQSGFENGCPLATVALEAASQSDIVRDTCAANYRTWEQTIAAQLVAAGVDDTVAESTATLVLSAVEGAMLLARVYRSTEPIDRVGALLKQQFEAMTA
jgi:TetR/AcrR family transcriptional repressor of lmrAB and yxaGH operons